MYSHFDVNHWFRVKQARDAQGLNRISDAEKLRPDHRLANAKLTHLPTGKNWTVVSVREDWWLGRFLTVLLENNGSHRTCVVENISCEAPDVVTQLGVFNTEFAVTL